MTYLRDYQLRLLAQTNQAMRRHRRVCLQSPTGSGKTRLAVHLLKDARARSNFRAWMVVHRKELLGQACAALRAAGVPHGVIGHRDAQEPIQVATIQTLSRRVKRLQLPQAVILDEAHHATARTWKHVLDNIGNAFVLGLTATPSRTDGRGLDDIFDELIVGPGVTELTAAGYLAPYRIIAPPRALDTTGIHRRGGDFAKNELEQHVEARIIVGDAVAHYKKYVAPKTCLIYCVSRHHARMIEEAYRSAGIDARYCAGDTPAPERDAIVNGFRKGTPPVIVSVDLFGEGLDVPGLQAVQLLRPTVSLGLHLQQIGRALRPEANKEHAIILDHVGNTWRHGLPDDEREWTLEGRKAEDAEEGNPNLRHCKNCLCIYPAKLPRCPVCGAEPEATAKRELPQHVPGELEEVDVARHRLQRRHEEGMARDADSLIKLAKIRGYKPPWVAYRLIAREKKAGREPDFYAVLSQVKRRWLEVDAKDPAPVTRPPERIGGTSKPRPAAEDVSFLGVTIADLDELINRSQTACVDGWRVNWVAQMIQSKHGRLVTLQVARNIVSRRMAELHNAATGAIVDEHAPV